MYSLEKLVRVVLKMMGKTDVDVYKTSTGLSMVHEGNGCFQMDGLEMSIFANVITGGTPKYATESLRLDTDTLNKFHISTGLVVKTELTEEEFSNIFLQLLRHVFPQISCDLSLDISDDTVFELGIYDSDLGDVSALFDGINELTDGSLSIIIKEIHRHNTSDKATYATAVKTTYSASIFFNKSLFSVDTVGYKYMGNGI